MRYLGSKTSLLEKIHQFIATTHPSGLFCDPFGGIGTVGAYFKDKGYQVYTGDILTFANCFQIAKIQYNSVPNFIAIKQRFNIEDIELFFNSLPKSRGWFVSEYSNKRLFFSECNSMHIQSCIDTIWEAHNHNLLSNEEYSFLVASLIDSMDLVANTAGTYYAYLKQLTRKATKCFEFRLLKPISGNLVCRSFIRNANELVRMYDYDILYLDPPYNGRNYQRYYHLPENIASKCVPQPLENKSGVYIQNSLMSDFNLKTKGIAALQDIIDNGQYKCVVFHYTDDGLIPQNSIRKILSCIGHVEEQYFSTRAYSTSTDSKTTKHHLYKVIRG